MAIQPYQVLPFKTGTQSFSKNQHVYSVLKKFGYENMSKYIINILSNWNSPFIDLLKYPTETFASEQEYMWKVYSPYRTNTLLLEARTTPTGTAIAPATVIPGVGSPIYLFFDKTAFGVGETIFGKNNDIVYLVKEVYSEGDRSVHVVVPYGDYPGGISGAELQPGEPFSWQAAPIERTESRNAGTLRTSTESVVYNEFSQIRMSHKVAGHALNDKLEVGIPLMDPATGNTTVLPTYISYVQLLFERQFAEYKCLTLGLGKSTRAADGTYTNTGISGNVIVSGRGYMPQIKDSANRFTYNNPKQALKIIDDFITNLTATIGCKKGLTIRIESGIYGIRNLSQNIKEMMPNWIPNMYINGFDAGIVSKAKQSVFNGATPELAFGAAFTEFHDAVGNTLQFVLNPTFDDPTVYKETCPLGGQKQSWACIITDMTGTQDGTPNVSLAAVQGRTDVSAVSHGPYNYWRNATDGTMMTDEDSAEYTVISAPFGIFIRDLSRVLLLEYAY